MAQDTEAMVSNRATAGDAHSVGLVEYAHHFPVMWTVFLPETSLLPLIHVSFSINLEADSSPPSFCPSQNVIDLSSQYIYRSGALSLQQSSALASWGLGLQLTNFKRIIQRWNCWVQRFSVLVDSAKLPSKRPQETEVLLLHAFKHGLSGSTTWHGSLKTSTQLNGSLKTLKQ